MNKFKYILLSFLVLSSASSFAKKVGGVKVAVSINLTSPLIQAINKNKTDSSSFRIPTNIALSATIKDKWLVRIGAGGYNNYQTLSSDVFTDRKIENVNKLSTLLSVYNIVPINEKWQCGLGLSLSAVLNKNEKYFDSGFDVLKSYTYTKGGGIGGGVFFQYSFNNRLSFFSEYNVLYNIYNSAEGKEFSSYPLENYAKNKLLNQGIQFQFPLALYINYQF
jgi:hypothetical protein